MKRSLWRGRVGLLTSTFALLGCLVPQALAQDAGAPQAAEEAEDEVIVVTGSYLRTKAQADLASPLQTVTAADIDAIGAQNIADLTQTLTINTGAQNNPDAFTQNQTTGTSSINLRGLGVGSTLVLLNGRRQVLTATQTNDGVSFVDTASLVPLIAIERAEIPEGWRLRHLRLGRRGRGGQLHHPRKFRGLPGCGGFPQPPGPGGLSRVYGAGAGREGFRPHFGAGRLLLPRSQ